MGVTVYGRAKNGRVWDQAIQARIDFPRIGAQSWRSWGWCFVELRRAGAIWPETCQAASGLELNFFPACFFDLGIFGVLFLRYLRKGKSEQKVGRSVPAAVAPRSFRRLALTLAILRSGVLPR